MTFNFAVPKLAENINESNFSVNLFSPQSLLNSNPNIGLPVHVPNFGGVAGSEDFTCATLPTTPFIFKARLKIFVTLPSKNQI